MVNWNKRLVCIGLEEIAKCRAQLLLEFKRLSDEYYHCERSTEYYDIIAGDWLEYFTHLTYVATVEGVANPPLSRSISPIPVSSDLIAHAELRLREFPLHDHLREAVAELMMGRPPTSWKFSTDSIQIVRGGRQGLGQRVFRSLATTRPDVLLVAPYFKCGQTEIANTLLLWRHWAAWDELQYPVRLSVMVDRVWRMKQAFNASPANDLLSVLRVLLPLHLPVALLEGFAAYRQAALAMPVARPKATYSANALHGHLTFKLLMAEWREEGTLLLSHQHGGGYGTDRALMVEESEIRVSDRYFTWGWCNADNPRVQPLSPAPLQRMSRERKFILLSCADFPKVVFRLHFHPMPGTIQTMHRETCVFLSALLERRNLLVRPYPHEYGWGFSDMMHKAAPDALLDDRRTGAFERYSQSRLVVHNSLGTGYLETLALNIPTVCFYDTDAYAFRDQAQPLMDGLESVGILHRSGKAAASFVDSLGADPKGWWERSDVQEARARFVDKYANFAPDWRKQWDREFHRAIEEESAIDG